MFCPNCGTQNPETANACSSCGTSLQASAPKAKGTLLMNQPMAESFGAPPAPPAPPPPVAPAFGAPPAPGGFGAPPPQGAFGAPPGALAPFGGPPGGFAPPPNMTGSGSLSTPPLAIVSLVAGIFFCIPFSALIAVICGFLARSAIAKEPDRYTGGGLALAGIILGFVQMLGVALYVLLVFVLGIAGAAAH